MANCSVIFSSHVCCLILLHVTRSPGPSPTYRSQKRIVITTDSLLFQIHMSEHNLLRCGELHDNLFLILSQLSSTSSYAVKCVHASNWFTHLQRTRQIEYISIVKVGESMRTICLFS